MKGLGYLDLKDRALVPSLGLLNSSNSLSYFLQSVKPNWHNCKCHSVVRTAVVRFCFVLVFLAHLSQQIYHSVR